MIGFNFRLGEIESAIGIEQIKKLPKLIKKRQNIADKLTKGLQGLQGLKLPIIEEHCSHVYYSFPMILDINLLRISKKTIF